MSQESIFVGQRAIKAPTTPHLAKFVNDFFNKELKAENFHEYLKDLTCDAMIGIQSDDPSERSGRVYYFDLLTTFFYQLEHLARKEANDE